MKMLKTLCVMTALTIKILCTKVHQSLIRNMKVCFTFA